MLRACLPACVVLSLAACGPKIPQHDGYKTKAPWKKPKALAFDDKLELKAKGELDYASYKRARWFQLDLPEEGTLDLKLEYTPLDDAGSSTVAMEVLDGRYQVISEDEDAPLDARPGGEDEDEEDEDKGGETQKTRSLAGLPAGTYYVHVFVTGRRDTAEFKLAGSFVPVPRPVDTGFPKYVAYVPPLAVVPPEDDAPPPPKKDPPKGKGGGGTTTTKKPPPEEKPPTGATVSAAVIAATANGNGGTDITINVGQNDGVTAGRSGSIVGLKNGGFTLASCGQKSCKASVKATVDQVKSSKMEVVIK